MKLIAATLAFTIAAVAETKPRSGPSEYKSAESLDGITVAAELVPDDQLKNLFFTDLRHGYIVVEVAVYPEVGKSVDLSLMDFLLRGGADRMIRAANPQAIPRAMQDKDAPRPSDVSIYPSVGVAYENGPYGRRVYTTGGVAVASGPTDSAPPAPTPRDSQMMRLELEEKGIPEGTAAKAVAGYLYFPYSGSKRKKVSFELEYYSPSGPVHLALK